MLPVFGVPQRVLSHGSGCYVVDVDGKRYLDLLAGIAVNTLGHGHPALVEAVAKQAAQLIHVSNFFTTEPQVELAETLLRIAGAPNGSAVFFANSGTEAIEAAVKLTRRTGRTRIFAAESSFHGRSTGALALTWKPAYREPFEPLMPDVGFVPYNDAAALEGAVRQAGADAGRDRPGTGPRRGRRPSRRPGIPAGGPRARHEGGGPARPRRGPVGDGPHRRLVCLPAERGSAGRGHHGQGPGRRGPDRGVADLRATGERAAHGRPAAFYQYWLSVEDVSVVMLLKVFTDLGPDEIAQLESATVREPARRLAQRRLAEEVTTLVHGEKAMAAARAASEAIFGKGDLAALDVGTLDDAAAELPGADLAVGAFVVDALVATGLVGSRNAARRVIGEGGVTVNKVKVADVEAVLGEADFLHGRVALLRRGRKAQAAIRRAGAAVPSAK